MANITSMGPMYACTKYGSESPFQEWMTRQVLLSVKSHPVGLTRFDDRITVTLIPTVEVLLIVPGRIPLCPGAYGTGDM